MMESFNNAISLLPDDTYFLLNALEDSLKKEVIEIRFRENKPITLNTKNKKLFLTAGGRMTGNFKDAFFVTDERKINEIVFCLSRRSIHTYQDMLRKGFLPLKNGCKAGVVGTAVIKNNQVYSVSSFSSLNIRISREFMGCSEKISEILGENPESMLLVGQPLSGKTTLLRDLCRYYAGSFIEEPRKIAIIDERDEIASKSFGFGIDVGVHTDVLSLYPKSVGIDIALRTLSPDIIVLDEIGAEDEINKMLFGMNSGVKFFATAHGNSFKEVLLRPNIKKLVDSSVFKTVVVLKGKDFVGEISEVIKL